MQTEFDIAIIGGGLAGLTAALEASRLGLTVLLIEKGSYPRHKVCGEFISAEGVSEQALLGLDIKELGAVEIDQFLFTHYSGKSTQSDLPLKGYGISRYKLESTLVEMGKKRGVKVLESCRVESVTQEIYGHQLKIQNGITYKAKAVIGAFGKRSKLQINRLNRSSYFAVKTHLKMDFPENEVQLHLFPQGYAGLSRVEEGRVNFCYMGSQNLLKKWGGVESFQKQVVFKNPFLKQRIQNAQELLPEPLTISQIDFEPRPLVYEGVLHVGDSAGMIYPLTGNGMTMAIKGSLMAVRVIKRFLSGEINRNEMEKKYSTQWNQTFGGRLSSARMYQRFFNHPQGSRLAVNLMSIPFLKKPLIAATHGSSHNTIAHG